MAQTRDWKGMKEMSARLLNERTGQDLDSWNQRIKTEGFTDEQALRAWLTDQGVTGYGLDRTYKGLICGITLHTAHINLMFARGTELPDPEGLLVGNGKRARHVKIQPWEECFHDKAHPWHPLWSCLWRPCGRDDDPALL